MIGEISNMARMGRRGDTMMGHLTPGEMVLPASVQTPGMIAMIASKMRRQGQNPAEFVVGSRFNKRNPQTGAAEFYDFGADVPGADMSAALGDFGGVGSNTA